MRRYIIDVHGDNDDLHKKALEAALETIKQINHAPSISAVVIVPPPSGFEPIFNCTRRVK